MATGNSFENAANQVEAWLNGAGAGFANRKQGRARSWDIPVDHPAVVGSPVRLTLPPDFPATPAQLQVDPSLCLKIPHVEETGKLCLSNTTSPDDYGNPCEAVCRVLREFKDGFLLPAESPDWVQDQFHSERLSYWIRFCYQRRRARSARPVAKSTYIALKVVEGWAEGAVAGYVRPGSKHRRSQRQVACIEAQDPHELAQRHEWANGTLIRGYALFVEMPLDTRWTPENWPKDFSQLHTLVGKLTSNESLLYDWMLRVKVKIDRPRQKQKSEYDEGLETGLHPLLVVLVQGSVVYGYQLFPSTVAAVTLPAVEPIELNRVDPAWCLTRDQAPAAFSARQAKKVLVLGCGSLGSPLVELLARAGVGTIDIVDSEAFEGPNTSRHVLGMGAIGRGKADALAKRLSKNVPGVAIKGYLKQASTWVTTKCEPGGYDLVVDCTAESTVRTMLSHCRERAFGGTPIVHAWVEPFCAAAHVVLTCANTPWPTDDPADRLVNAADFSNTQVRIDLPACSGGFHPYGAADVWQAAAFTSERVLFAIDDQNHASTIWSWVRSKAFFDELGLAVPLRAVVPSSGGRMDSVMLTRDYQTVLAGA